MYKSHSSSRETALPFSSPIIDTSSLAARLDDAALRIVDCRFDLMQPAAGRDAWLAGHIPGAIFADLDQDLAGPVTADTGRHPLPDPEAFARSLGQLGIANDSDVVVYDAGSGAIAARAWWLLEWLGHEHVAVLERGFDGWLADGGATESGEVVVPAREYVGAAQNERIMTTGDNKLARTLPAWFALCSFAGVKSVV